MYSLVQIDKHSFDTTIEHFSFPPFHRIEDMGELTKLSFLPRLRSATFTGTGLDDRGLLGVCGASTIENLDLQDTKVSNDGLACLARLPNLRHLRLKDNRQLTNACIPTILQLRALVDLQVHETSIDQAGVNQLVTLSNLRDLCVYVEDDNYSFEELLQLSARMPRCTILAKGRGEFLGGAFEGTWTR
ncbi:MAG: hypothetical protein H6708_17370 [Kofleriaceae bacterium]|nr:hypothetical protein [Myxococcales bacterium]MCB9562177.1 hypothetical protein [Kofleriaceae bacterium]